MQCYIHDLDDSLAKTTEDLNGDPARIPLLTPVDGAIEFLKKHRHHNYLVTAGVDADQQKKIDVLRVRKYFRKIFIVPTSEDKREALRELVGTLPRIERRFITVIGDRLDVEIRTGNELGCTTVRVQLPGGRHSTMMPRGAYFEVPHHTVRNFRELLSLYPD